MKRRFILGPYVYSNPYSGLFADALALKGEVRRSGKWDYGVRGEVIFLGWIERKLVDSEPLGRLWKRWVLHANLLFQRYLGRKIVMTLHNRVPHDVPRSDLVEKLLPAVYGQANAIVVHTEEARRAVTAWKIPTKVIFYPHPNYSAVYPKIHAPRPNRPETTVVCFGFLRPYKGLERLIGVFRTVHRPDLRLAMRGRCSDSYAAQLHALAAGDSRISIENRFLETEELGEFLMESDLAVLPYEGESVLTSGAAALCATLGVPFAGRCGSVFQEYEGREGFRSFETDSEMAGFLEQLTPRKATAEALVVHSKAASWDGLVDAILTALKEK